MAISHLQLPSFEHVAEASVVGAAQLQAMPDPHAISTSVVFDLDQVNDAGYLLKSGWPPMPFIDGLPCRLVWWEIQRLQ